MIDAAVLFVKPGAVRPSDKGALRKAGIVVVEVDDPQAVRLVRAESVFGAGAELPRGDLLRVLAKGCDAGDYKVHGALTRALTEAIRHRYGEVTEADP
jgi:hypothetical protein